MKRDDLKLLFLENINSKRISGVLTKRDDLKSYLLQCTDYLSKEATYTERIYQVLNDLYNENVCEHCEKPTNFIDVKIGYHCPNRKCLIKNGGFKRKPVSAQGRKNMSDAQLKFNKSSEAIEIKARANEKRIATLNSPEVRANLRSKKLGIKQSDTHIKKRMDSQKEYYLNPENKKQTLEKRTITMMKRYGVTSGRHLQNSGNFFSKVSQELFNIIQSKLNLTHVYYATHNQEFLLTDGKKKFLLL